MELFKSLQMRTESLDEKKFRYIILGVAGLFLLIIFIVIFMYYSSLKSSRKTSAQINQKRLEVRNLLERYEMVKKQKFEVDALLAKDKEFKIGGYFNELIIKFGLEKNKTREPETSREVLDNGYTEVKLYASFAQLNIKQVAELLDVIEQNDRVYTKEVEMYKQNGQTMNVNLLIATVEPKSEELPEAAE